jgi:protein associated with RNAse G/E
MEVIPATYTHLVDSDEAPENIKRWVRAYPKNIDRAAIKQIRMLKNVYANYEGAYETFNHHMQENRLLNFPTDTVNEWLEQRRQDREHESKNEE